MRPNSRSADGRESRRAVPRSHAELYNLDPDHIAVFGPSAGGHLSLIAGLTGNEEDYVDERWPGVSSEVSAIATFYPAAYFGESGEPGYDLGSMHLGCSPHDPANAEATRDASAASHIAPDSPPVLLIHGSEDKIVPIAFARFDATSELLGWPGTDGSDLADG